MSDIPALNCFVEKRGSSLTTSAAAEEAFSMWAATFLRIRIIFVRQIPKGSTASKALGRIERSRCTSLKWLGINM
ncbi:hypothetical protein AALC17_14285 [Oscillospiraceae bacterium 38-13]